MVLAVPILEKVHNKNLILYDYTISPIHARALQMAVKYFENFVHKVLFDNCGLNDESFAKIIESCNQLKEFKSIVYLRNEFGMQSAQAFFNLLKRKVPHHLDEFKIQDCKIYLHTSEFLISNMLEQSHLRSLQLTNIKLSSSSL